MSPRSRALATALVLLPAAACHSGPPAPPPLLVTGTVDVEYEGRIAPLAEGETDTLPESELRTAAYGTPTVVFHTTVLELPLAEARAFVPGLVAEAPPPVEALPDGSTREWSERRVVSSAGPMHTTRRQRAVGLAGGLVDRAALRSAMPALIARGEVATEPLTAASTLGNTLTLSTQNEKAFVRGMRLTAVADSILVEDIEVATFRVGWSFRLTANAAGDALEVAVQWNDARAVHPVPHGGGIQLPVIERHRVSTRAVIDGGSSLVVGSLPGHREGTVQLLCVEIDPPAVATASR
jgi:hypothetical protein